MLTAYTCLLYLLPCGVVKAACATSSQPAVPAPSLCSMLPTTYYLLLTRAGVAGVAAVAGDGDAKVGGGALGRR